MNKAICWFGAVATLPLLAACGGGGASVGSAVVSAPTPPPPPTPTPTPTPPPMTAQLFAQPVDGPLTVLTIGAATSTPNAIVTPSIGGASQFEIRYISAQQRYEVTASNFAPATLERTSTINNPQIPYAYLEADSATDPERRLTLNQWPYGTVSGSTDAAIRARFVLYPGAGGGSTTIQGWAAIGMATPSAAIPISGTATYSGTMEGSYQELSNGAWSEIAGPLSLSIDFATKSLSGMVTLADNTEPGWGGPDIGAIGSFNLTPTTLSASGSFATSFQGAVGGVNLFNGQLAGPSAGNVFGVFALPFAKDGRSFQSWGAWVARQ